MGRLRLVPVWAAWAFALTRPLTMVYFAVHVVDFRYVLRDLICVLWIAGAIPAAVAMLKNKDLAEPETPPA